MPDPQPLQPVLPQPDPVNRQRNVAAHRRDGLRQVVSGLHRAVQRTERVTVGDLVDAMGPASMSAVLLIPALLLVSPLSGVPGASLVGGTLIALIAAQIVLRRDRVWLPQMLRRRGLPGPLLRRALLWLRRPAGWLDGLASPRQGRAGPLWWARGLALLCVALGLVIPFLELVPFASSLVASLVSALALAMLTGRLRFAVVALALIGGAVGAAVWAV